METGLSRYLVALLVFLGIPRIAAMECPDPMEPTIESLHHCVMHAADMEHIDNDGIARSLEAKLETAQAAQDRRQTEVSVRLLLAFIREVNAQAGNHVEAEHAQHMIHHAQLVIEALES